MDRKEGQILTLGLEREGLGLEEFTVWVENRTLSQALRAIMGP